MTARRGSVARVLAVVLGVSVTVAPELAGASPSASSGFGSRAQAFAGADVADPHGGGAVFENPAALVHAADTELSLGTSVSTYDFSIDGEDTGLPAVPAFDFGAVVPGSVLTVPVAFGLALSLPDGRFSKLHNADPTVAYYPLDDAGPRLLDLGLALAIRPLPWLAVGGGVGFLAAAQGGFRVEGNAVAADGSGNEYASELRHSVDADLVSVRYPLFGATITASKALVLGVAYRGAATIEQRVAGELDGTALLGTARVPVRYRFETRASLAFVPATLALGATARPLPDFRVSAQLDWEGWSSYPSPFAAPETTLEIEPPPGVVVTPPEQTPVPVPVVFRDRWVPRIGLEHRFEVGRSLELKARAGYAYEAAVVPARQEQTLLVDFDRHVAALGAGADFRRPFRPFSELRLDVHVSLAAGVGRDLTTGPSSEAESERVGGRQFGAGATLGLAFDALGRSPREGLY
ncbi:MAG TPA: outer membrane protein transport protein [Polyangiaceae bacterium]